MKLIFAAILTISSLSAFAGVATAAQKRIICEEAIRAGELENGQLNACVQRYIVEASSPQAGVTLLQLRYLKAWCNDEHCGGESRTCFLRYTGPASRPIINRSGLRCRTNT